MAAALTMLLSAVKVDAAIVREPYLQVVTPDSVTVVWRTDLASPTDSRVQYGLVEGAPDLEATSTSVIPASNANVRDHIVTISGLSAATKYFYNVGTTSGGVEAGGTANHYFVSAPNTGLGSNFTAWIVGDSGDNGANQAAVRDAMLAVTGATPPDIFLHMGDIAYNNGTDSEYTNNHFGPYADILRNTACYPTLGNHDSDNTTSGACWPLPCAPGATTGPYYEAHVLPTAGEAGGEPSGTESYYSFDYANVHFVVLNSDQVSRSASGPMAEWLTADLAGTTQDWVIAYWHHPPYTKGTHDSDNSGDSGGRLVDMRENFLPILEAGGVDLVMGGHSHIYERSYLIDGAYGYGSSPNFATPNFATLDANGNIIDSGDGDPAGDGAYVKNSGLGANEGAVYVVAGHGGRSVGGSANHPVMASADVDFGSCLLTVQGNTLTMSNIRDDQTITDTFSIVKGTCEDFETGFTIGQPVGDHAEWFDDGGGPVVTAGAGTGGSVGLAPSGNIFTWTANPFDWTSKSLAGVVVQLDLQTDATGLLDDDRVGWMISDISVNSDFIFGVQVDPSGGGDDGDPAGSTRLEGYWDATINVDEDKRPFIDSVAGNLVPDTFYRLRAEFTRLSATSARVDASLTELDALGIPVAGPPVLAGTIADTSLLGADAPDLAYFTNPIWPAFKNHTAGGANADNACFELFESNIVPIVATFQQGQNGYSSNVDTYLEGGNPDVENSGDTTLVVDLSPERHILMRFDDMFGTNGGQIPPTADILSATLTVEITNSSPGVGASLYRMLQTWNDTDTWNTWIGGIQNDGAEAAVAADASGSSDVGPYELDVTTSVEAWLADPSSNHGWAWLPPAQDNSWQMDSSEGAVPPELRVVYQIVCGDDSECDDGDPCTTDTCLAGACENEPVVCGEGEVCNESTGDCVLTSAIMFQDGADSYAGTDDTFVQVAVPGNVNGALEVLEWDDDDPSGGVVEPNFGLLRFDNIFGAGPGLIPTGSQIVSATLTYTVFDQGFTASVREVLVDWDEGDSLTSMCGGSCDEGAEYGATEVASAVGPVGAQNADVTASLQAWSDNPANNFGWFFISQTGAGTGGGVQVRSSEYVATPSERPKLAVVYVAGCDVSADCDDGNDCTDDLCNSSGFCEYSNNTDPCDDGDFCTESDTCSAGACAGSPVDCGGQVCNPVDGGCVDCLSNTDCDNNDTCDGDETCDANTCQAGTPLDCDDLVACTTDSCDPIDGCMNVDNCTAGQVCNLGTGFCEAGPLFTAYNDMNPSAGDSNDTNVTEHDYSTVDGVLVDYDTGTPTSVTITGSFVGGLDDNFPSNGGQANGGTDAGDTFGPSGAVIVDMLNTIELDDPSWDNIITLDNLDSTKRYTITLSANRDNPTYDDARFARVTIEGADTFANDSSAGVVVNSADSVSFSIGHNTVNGYVARWTNVVASDGSFSIKSEWDDGLGSGGSNTKGYAMTALKLEEFANTCGVAAECDDGLYCNGVEDCIAGICSAGTPPCGEGAAVCNEDTDTCAVLCDLDLLDEDFNSYSVGQDPTDWYDTAADSATTESTSLFDVKQVGGDLVLGTDSSDINIHSHYVGAGADSYTSMTYTGRMRLTDDNGGIGVTFLSGFADSPTPAYDYHRLRRANFAPSARTFQLEPPNANGLTGDLDSGVDPVVDTWYRFRIVVDAEQPQVRIRANVWEDGQAEPAGFQIDATDTGGLNRTVGTVGTWSMLDGSKYWDDLKVVDGRLDLPCDDGDACTIDDTCSNGVCTGTLVDCDGDGVCDFDDNCPTVPNPGQDPAACNGPFDFDNDGDVDLADFAVVHDCLGGPGELTPPGGCDPGDFSAADVDTDGDVDLDDFRQFQSLFTDEIVSPCE
ncbi:MAG: hypothetical protein DHS20C16_15930 [Phycisphaerae bacterium]|nr:MAG: hypothetical protein DHS20C16_15930 [Phycisphaerae bacterium]